MRVIIVGKFPRLFVERHIIPKLEEHEIDVVSYESRHWNFANVQRTDADAILFLYEMASHNEQEQTQLAAQSLSIPMVLLSRKESFWQQQFAKQGLVLPERTKMSKPLGVKDINGFFMRLVELQIKGKTYDEMIPHLRQFWPELQDKKGLANFLSRMRHDSKGRLPQFFIDYEERKIIPSKLQQISEPIEIKQDKKPGITDSELLSIAEKENIELREQLDEVRKAVDDLKKRSISNGGTRVLLLKKNASIIRDGIGTQLFSLNEAFEKLHKLVQEL